MVEVLMLLVKPFAPGAQACLSLRYTFDKTRQTTYVEMNKTGPMAPRVVPSKQRDDRAVVLVDGQGQPQRYERARDPTSKRALPFLLAHAEQAAGLVGHLRSMALQRSPARAALAQLSWAPQSPHTAGAHAAAWQRGAVALAQWAVWAAGLVAGLVVFPVVLAAALHSGAAALVVFALVHAVRCAWAASQICTLRQGVAGIDEAQRVWTRCQNRTAPSRQEAVLHLEGFRQRAGVYPSAWWRGLSPWAQRMDEELLDYFDGHIEGFAASMQQTRAKASASGVRRNSVHGNKACLHR